MGSVKYFRIWMGISVYQQSDGAKEQVLPLDLVSEF